MPYEFSGDDDLNRSTNKFMVAGAVLMLLMVMIFPLYLSVEPTNRSDARATQQASLVDSGAILFDQSCASCHGKDALGGDSPALNAKQFLASVDNSQIELIVSVGIPGTEMPAWSQDFAGALTSEQIKSIATYLRSLEPTAPDNPNWRQGKVNG